MGLKVTKPTSFVEWCNALSGWQAMTLTSIRLPQARSSGAFKQGASTSVYSLANDSYDFGDPNQDQTLAFYYLVYRRKCKQGGFEPSKYSDPTPDNKDLIEPPDIPNR